MSLNVVLLQPEIPQNTGNIARTCACVDARLHVVRPLGFQLTERNLRRSGMDYFERIDLTIWDDTEAFLSGRGEGELYLFTGRASRGFGEVDYKRSSERGDVYLVFGRESTGIDDDVLARYPDRCVRIPMVPGLRSLNLANSVAIAVYEHQRQLGYPHLV